METNTSSLEPLRNDNYPDWSVKMKNKLLEQGLWDIVETGLELPEPKDDDQYEARKKMNEAALYAIQSSCRMDIESRIKSIGSAKTAWKVLGKISIESKGQEKLTQTENNNSINDEGKPSSSNNNPKQIEDDDLINEEGNSSSSDSPVTQINESDCAMLLKAVRSGNLHRTKLILSENPHALTARITSKLIGGTVLHAAVDADQENIVEWLVEMIPEQILETMKDNAGFTALQLTTISGNQRMAECLIAKNERLVRIGDNEKRKLPVTLAMACGHKELAHYLYFKTPLVDLAAEGSDGASLLNSCIYNRDFDVALDLMERSPRLAFASDYRSNKYPLEVLADVSTDAFESGKGMVFWKQWIYNHCIPDISLYRAIDEFRLNIRNGEENTQGSVRGDLWRKLASSLLNLLGFKCLYEMKLAQVQFQQLLSFMSQACPRSVADNFVISRAMFSAIRRGNFEFVCRIIEANPDFLWLAEKRNIFQWAVLYRQHRIFSLIYSLKQKNALLLAIDESENTILHMAGMVIENTTIDHIRGAALQMQREVQWFKEVERICGPLSFKDFLNADGLTAKQLFTKGHKEMRKEGERWMKDTATSCTVVGALIITIMFAAAFTIPGGNNQDSGLPILVHDKLFKLFIVTDSLSLFSSSTSVLMFLGILTSRYAEEDFLTSLPRKMMIGLFALFFSIAAMMIAFSAALSLMLRGKYRIVVPIISLAGIPVILFVLMQSHLLVDMFISTYRPGIFDRKNKAFKLRADLFFF